MKIFVTGANSAIAKEMIEIWAAQGADLFLTSQNASAIETTANDLCVRYTKKVDWRCLDVTDYEETKNVFLEACKSLGEITHVLMAHGFLGEPEDDFSSLDKLLKSLDINFQSCVNLAFLAGHYFQKKGGGHLIAIGSVAGDRGRASNFVYGTGKGALHLFFQGLRGHLQSAGISVTLVKPGLVATPMTGKSPGLLVASPQKVAKSMVRGIAKKKEVLYVPWFWRWIMLIIRSIPEKIFKRLSI